MHVNEVIARIEAVAPPKGQAAWDASGVQVAGSNSDVRKLALALDPLPQTVAAAMEWGADMLLTHHPLSMKPRGLHKLDAYHETVSLLLGKKAWLYAAHTSLDVQSEGPVGWLAREMGLQNTRLLETTYTEALQGVRFQADSDLHDLRRTLEAMDDVLHMQEPFDEELFIVCTVSRWPAIKAEIARHNDAAAFAMLELTLPEQSWGFGLVGDLPQSMPFREFCAALASVAPRRFYQLMGPRPETVSRVAYCTGSGSSFMDAALKAGADVFVTGDMKYHQALEAPLCVIDVGHFVLEEEMMKRFAQQLAEDPQLADLELLFFSGNDPFDLLLLGQEPQESL